MIRKLKAMVFDDDTWERTVEYIKAIGANILTNTYIITYDYNMYEILFEANRDQTEMIFDFLKKHNGLLLKGES